MSTMGERSIPEIAAISIPPGEYHVGGDLDDRLRVAVHAPPRGRSMLAHPAFAFIVAMGGMGTKIGDLCRSLGLAFDSGAVLGRCRISYERALEVDRSYRIE